MEKTLKLGMIGLDTSHVTAFASILNDSAHPYHVQGGKIEVAYSGVPSADFELSYGRVARYTEELTGKYEVKLVNSPEAVAEECDAVLLVSVDGRVHLDVFKQIAPYGKPIFVDKPFTVNSKDAQEIFAVAALYHVPIMSCSSLRYAEPLISELISGTNGVIIGADCYGPMSLEPSLPGYYWYGIHTVEMIYRILGGGCASVSVTVNEDHDVIVGTWKDGRIGVVRGNRKGNSTYGALVHREDKSCFVDISAHSKPTYAGMLERIMHLFHTGQSDIEAAETVEIIRFIECANESRLSGKTVQL